MADLINKNEQLIIGINWGGVKTSGWFGSVEYTMADLDLNILIVDAQTKKIKEIVNKMNKKESSFVKEIEIEISRAQKEIIDLKKNFVTAS